ncbi:hypothetical protein [Ruminiclostridium cellulolyticum]|uniref:Uncharacterized protein n=1 Tax=Ruminiclostridium cellulolyticum (strain ATCC 35319 / DSM 5812 / JCM 6584 / H10) TaxID=394503 RepID=B8I4W6_RUMCH|nr:hypothetical protein [Ruminiclostridium cellulolyticum]ACL76620.1 hypothetical protein Ccel_2283 [Ruminiclostridium cellulolyticum H10]
MANNFKTGKMAFYKTKAIIAIIAALIIGAIIIALILTGFPSSKKIHNKGVYVLNHNPIEFRL